MVKCPNHCRTDRSGTGDGERIGSSAEPIIRAERNSERINREEIAMFKWCTHHCLPLRSAPLELGKNRCSNAVPIIVARSGAEKGIKAFIFLLRF